MTSTRTRGRGKGKKKRGRMEREGEGGREQSNGCGDGWHAPLNYIVTRQMVVKKAKSQAFSLPLFMRIWCFSRVHRLWRGGTADVGRVKERLLVALVAVLVYLTIARRSVRPRRIFGAPSPPSFHRSMRTFDHGRVICGVGS